MGTQTNDFRRATDAGAGLRQRNPSATRAYRHASASLALGSLILVLPKLALADVVISTGTTQDMSCSGGVCAPTAADAVLNVNDLENLLTSGNVEVTTTGSGVQADNIDVTSALSWSTSSALALDAYQSITVDADVSVESLAGLTLTTNDGGTSGTLSFGDGGNVSFADLGSALTINGASYTLVDTIQTLAAAIAANAAGNYAFAAPYDAQQDGTYSTVPIPTTLTGTVEGLGNAISHFKLKDSADTSVGLFAEVGLGGTLRDLGLTASSVEDVGGEGYLGTLVGTNAGSVVGCRASGSIRAEHVRNRGAEVAGGLVGLNESGTVASSYATTSVTAPKGALVGGGLVGDNGGSIENSYANGNVVGDGFGSYVGGLVGGNFGPVNGTFATGSVTGGKSSHGGGLVGITEDQSQIDNSYAIGSVTVGSGKIRRGFYSFVGGLVGESNTPGEVSNSYSTGTATPGGSDSYAGGSMGTNWATRAKTQ